jgi:hypothetical protein
MSQNSSELWKRPCRLLTSEPQSVLIDNKWQNVMSVIRLSSDCTVTASARMEQIWGQHGAVHTDEFRIDYRVVPFSEWTALLDG